MKKTISLLITLCMLTGCSSDTASTPTESKFTMTYPEELSDGQKDKIAIDDIYILDSKEQDLIVVNYHFKQCWFNDAASFADTYSDSVFVNNIEALHSSKEFEDCEAQYESKLLSLTYANVKVGYEIKDYDNSKTNDFKLILVKKDTPSFKLYEIDGVLDELRVEKE